MYIYNTYYLFFINTVLSGNLLIWTTTVALGVGSRAGAGRPLAGDQGYWTVMRGDRSRRTCGGFCGTAQTGDHGGQTAVRYTHRTSPSHTHSGRHLYFICQQFFM